MKKQYLCIDLKSFFASVECVERGLDPMTTLLAVCDLERTDKTICLAITPAMKALGIKNRCRVFEIPKSVDFIAATPRMHLYMDYAAQIYGIYLNFVSKDDIHVYSIDEAFLDVTDYLDLYKLTARQLGRRIMDEIYSRLGIRATCGIGTNLFLTKIALDIEAKHAEDFIGELDEESFMEKLWDHKPITDFWKIGSGTAKRLEDIGVTTMRGICEMPEDTLYHMFGVDAELLIDHAHGYESASIRDIKQYKAKTNSLSSGQVLPCDYNFEKGRLIVKEMTDLMCLDLVEKGLVTKSLTLSLRYSKRLGLLPANGTAKLYEETNSDLVIIPAMCDLYDKIMEPSSTIRGVSISCNNVIPEEYIQYSFFTNAEELEKNRKVQKAVISIKNKFGKNAIVKGMNLEEGAKTIERNSQIGGHRSGV